MATAVVAGLPSRPESATPPVPQPLQAYAANHDSAEQGVPGSTDEMQPQPQPRKRLQQGQSGSASHEQEERPSGLETTLNSGQNNDDETLGGESYTICYKCDVLILL